MLHKMSIRLRIQTKAREQMVVQRVSRVPRFTEKLKYTSKNYFLNFVLKTHN